MFAFLQIGAIMQSDSIIYHRKKYVSKSNDLESKFFCIKKPPIESVFNRRLKFCCFVYLSEILRELPYYSACHHVSHHKRLLFNAFEYVYAVLILPGKDIDYLGF